MQVLFLTWIKHEGRPRVFTCSLHAQYIYSLRRPLCPFQINSRVPLPWLLLLALILQRPDCLFVTSSCAQHKNYTVSSSGHDSPDCLSGHSDEPCKSLGHLLTGVSSWSCVNVTILDHQTLSRSFQLSPLTDVIISGAPGISPFSVNISCANESGLAFMGSQRVYIKGLRFIACAMKCPHNNAGVYPLVDLAAICVYRGKNITISRCGFMDGVGTGVIMHDVTGSNRIIGSNFVRNGVNILKQAENTTDDYTSGGLIIKRQYVAGEASYVIENCSFVANKNQFSYNYHDGLGGGVHFHFGSPSSTTHVYLNLTQLSGNSGACGGGVNVNQSGTNSSLGLDMSQSQFQSNYAKNAGGGMFLTQNLNSTTNCSLKITNCTFSGNSGSWGGGLAVYGASSGGLIDAEIVQSQWSMNYAREAGFAVGFTGWANPNQLPNNETVFRSFLNFKECSFTSNSAAVYSNENDAIGAVQVRSCKSKFSSCSFVKNSLTALHVFNFTYAILVGNTTFIANSGVHGGGIHVGHRSLIGLSRERTFLRFEDNYALFAAGALFSGPTDTSLKLPQDTCVFESLSELLTEESSSNLYRMYFKNNTVNGENQSIFVGSARACLNSNGSILFTDDRVFTFVPPISENRSQVLSIPDPDHITLSFRPHKTEGHLEVMPGQYFYLVPNVTDIFYNPRYIVGHLLLAMLSDNEIVPLEDLKLVGPSVISMDNYTQDNELYIRGSRSYLGHKHLYILFFYAPDENYHGDHRQVRVELVDCRPGFVYSNSSKMCECIDNENLVCTQHYTYACVKHGYWLGDYNQTNGKALPCFGEYCQYSRSQCPTNASDCPGVPGYCQLNDTDDLCWEGRGGIMCASCKQNYSFTFGALNCVHNSTCSGPHTTIVMFSVLLYWIFTIILVLVILNLDLNMGLGFLYGIVYYFSILALFTDLTITDPFLLTVIYTSIAVTQLIPRGFGNIDYCFAKSWDLNVHHYFFNYATPLFVITVIVLIICLSRYCRCPKVISLAENSPIHAICVLVLFSYTSLTYTNFNILRPIWINGEARVHVDPHIKYFSHDHLPYAIVAILLEFFISFPICFLFLFAPCLAGRVNMVKLRLKPILDDFQACYRQGCYWFAGFYFLARQVMFLANIVPIGKLPQENNLIHVVNIIVLLVHSTIQPYKLKWLNFLDTLLLLDVLVLSIFASADTVHKILTYLFILLPAFYLLAVILLITFRRVSKCLLSFETFKKLITAVRRKRVSTDPAPAFPTKATSATSTSVGFDDGAREGSDKAKMFGNSDFFKDYGEREPLLADATSHHQPSWSSSDRESSRAYTTSSLRVSTLENFPPSQTKARTN